MELNKYQLEARKFVSESIKSNPNYFAMGLAGETGEVLEKMKKSMRDNVLNAAELQKELGDVLWYLSQLADCFAMDLEGVAKLNLHKLQSRLDRGKIGGSGDNR